MNIIAKIAKIFFVLIMVKIMDIIKFIFDKLPYIVDFRSNELICSDMLCNFVKSDLGNFIINYLGLFVLFYILKQYARKISNIFR